MILTIDGPAGAGKSSVTRQLAQRIGFQFLDTGAMYRAITWAALDSGTDPRNEAALLLLAIKLKIELLDDTVLVDRRDVTTEIRDPKVTVRVAAIADAVSVREYLVEKQREIVATGDFVSEGRDQGTVAFPDAFCKIFLTASAQQRALRRAQQLEAAGQFVDFDQVIREQNLRDQQDESRSVGKLVKAKDAIVFDTDGKTISEVVDELEAIARSKMSDADLSPSI